MRESRPPNRMKEKDGGPAKNSPRTDSIRIMKWEWVEEELECKYSISQSLRLYFYCWLTRNCLLQVATDRYLTMILLTIIGKITYQWKEEKTKSVCIQGLQFVTESGVARPHGSFRDLIRSKARRKGKTQSEYAQASRKSSATRSTLDIDTDSERSRTTTPTASGVVTPKTALKTPQALLCKGLERGLVDPFYTLPISESGETQLLIHHCEFSFRIESREIFLSCIDSIIFLTFSKTSQSSNQATHHYSKRKTSLISQ